MWLWVGVGWAGPVLVGLAVVFLVLLTSPTRCRSLLDLPWAPRKPGPLGTNQDGGFGTRFVLGLAVSQRAGTLGYLFRQSIKIHICWISCPGESAPQPACDTILDSRLHCSARGKLFLGDLLPL